MLRARATSGSGILAGERRALAAVLVLVAVAVIVGPSAAPSLGASCHASCVRHGSRTSHASGTDTYMVTPITAPGGGSVDQLYAINAGGEIVGSGTHGGTNVASCGFAWQNGTFTWLTPGYVDAGQGGTECDGPQSSADDAYDVNDAGEIVGDTEYLYTGGGGTAPYPSYQVATSWTTAQAAPTALNGDCTQNFGTLTGAPGFSDALAVNSSGSVAGHAQTPASTGGCTSAAADDWAFVGSPTHVVAPPSSCSGCGSYAFALNHAGQAVIYDGGGQSAGISNGGAAEQPLQLSPSGVAGAINDAGAVVGQDLKSLAPAYSVGAGARSTSLRLMASRSERRWQSIAPGTSSASPN